MCNALFGAFIVGPALGELATERSEAALNADRISVRGDVYLDDGFHTHGEVRLVAASLGGHLECSDCYICNHGKDALSLSRSKCHGHVFLPEGCKLQGALVLVGSTIDGNLYICATIKAGGDLQASNGNEAISGDRLLIGGNCYLYGGCNVQGTMCLDQARIGGDLRFGDSDRSTDATYAHELSLTSDEVSCRGVRVTGELRWMDVDGVDDHLSLNLDAAAVGILNEDPKSWASLKALSVNGLSYDTIKDDPNKPRLPARIEWLKKATTFSRQPSEQMAAALGRSGDEDGMTQVLVTKEDIAMSAPGTAATKRFWYCLYGTLVGYGYSPLRVFNFGILIILVGCIMFFRTRHAFVPMPKDAGRLSGGSFVPVANYPRFNPFLYSFETFAPLIRLYQAEFWFPNTGTPAGSVARWYLRFHIAAGWVITTIFVAGVVGLIHR